MKKSLFDLVVSEDELHPSFKTIRTSDVNLPTRWMFDRVFQHFHDSDGNFVQQFQTSGFDARVFELYLFAYFHYSGFAIDRTNDAPDFIVSRNGLKAAIEATTVNPPTSGVLAEFGKEIGELSRAELAEYLRHELPTRFGSPLLSKLQKKYWERPQLKDTPLILAIEAFHDEDSLGLSDGALVSYLYGMTHDAQFDEHGALSVRFDQIYSHIVGPKEIPSSFFDQPDTEHISAVMFTNAGTSAKFSRLAYQAGIGIDTIEMRRVGYCSNLDEDIRDPTFFSYDVGDPPVLESWGQGLVILHNPHCNLPVEIELFPEAAHTYYEDGKPITLIPNWHVFSSKTLTIDLGELKPLIDSALPRMARRAAVGGITRKEFHEWAVFVPSGGQLEDGWFCDEAMSLLGVLLMSDDRTPWAFVILGRDEFLQFYELESQSGFDTRFDALQRLQLNIASRLARSQRVFPR